MAHSRFRSLMAWPALLAAAVFAPASEQTDNLLTNPGFEADSGWRVLGDRSRSQIDAAAAHTGSRSLHCRFDQPPAQGGFVQSIRLDQRQARPLLIGGWSKARDVSGPRDNHYSIWCDVKYVEQLRPGRIDISAIAPFEVGDHDWQEARAVLKPQRPIATVNIYALFRRHTGEAWFDDIYAREVAPFRPPPLPPAAPTTSPITGGGLSLRLTADGGIGALAVHGQAQPVTRRSGVFVGDFNRQQFWAVSGPPQPTAMGARVRCELEQAELRVEYEICADEDAVQVSGAVTDLTARDRAIDVCFSLPVGAAGDRWQASLAPSVRLTNESDIFTDTIPLAAVTDGRHGVALGVPADFPSMFTIEWSAQTGLMARLRLGLSPEGGGALKSRAPFRFVLFGVSGREGFRQALPRYYALYSDLFQRRATREGLWLFAFSPKKLPNPQHYAYWEGGPGGAAEAKALGIDCYPYQIPCQRTIQRLPELPKNYEEAMARLDDYAPTWTGWAGKGTKEQILNAAIQRSNGRYDIVIRDDVGADVKPKNPINMVVFSVNCNPNLLADDPAASTPARVELRRAEQRVGDHPDIAGIYLDSMAGWSGRKLNFRRDHFRYETIPLTYEESSGRVAIHGQFDGVLFLQALRALLHPGGRCVFQNLGHGGRHVWHWIYGDVCGVEGGFRGLSLDNYRYFRAAAAQKPVLLLDYFAIVGRQSALASRAGMERYFHYAAAFGFFPAIGRYCDRAYDDFGDLYDRWIPLIQKLSHAGWNAITGATADNAQVSLERFGPKDGEVFLTVLNPTDHPLQTAIRWPAVKDVVLLPEERAPAANADISLRLAPDQVIVLRGRTD